MKESPRSRLAVDAIYRELTERRLDEIDPDWRDHFASFEAAERFYWRELCRLTDPIHTSPYEPPDYKR